MITLRKSLALLPLFLVGCVSAQATMLRPGQYAPVPEHEVRVFLQQSDVPSTCEQIALIHTEGDADITSETQMISAARRRAGKVGANALLLNNVKDPSTGTRIASAVFGVSANRKGQMVGLRCADAAAPTTATAQASQ